MVKHCQFWITVIAVLAFLMAACDKKVVPEIGSPSPSPTSTVSIARIMPTIVATGSPVFPTKIPQRTATQVILNFTPTLPIASNTLEPTEHVSTEICTPLLGHSLKDLLEIVTNPFAPPPRGKDDGHHGVDFAYYRRGERLSIQGVPIQSVMDGAVAGIALDRPPYGNMVIIETSVEDLPDKITSLYGILKGESLYLLYAHMNSVPAVLPNDSVQCGTIVGEVGNTPEGWSSNPHLHLETRIGKQGSRFPSLAFYTTSATKDEMNLYRLWRMSGEFRLVNPLLLLQHGLDASKVESE